VGARGGAVAPAPGRRQHAGRAPADCAGGPPRGGIERRLRGHTTTPCVGPQRPCVGGDARRVGKTGTAGSSRHWTAALEATQRPPAIEDGGGAHDESCASTAGEGGMTLKQVCSRVTGSARCVQRLDDSRSAIRITYRISLRSSSSREPRYPLLKVVRGWRVWVASVRGHGRRRHFPSHAAERGERRARSASWLPPPTPIREAFMVDSGVLVWGACEEGVVCAGGAPERARHTQEGMRERGSPTHPHTRLEGDVRFGIAW
jgi:hypothetical protein